MTDHGFNTWKLKHATLFRWGDGDLAMLDMWRELFDARGFTGEELLRGSMHLAEKEPKKWRAEHLEFLLTFVSNERLQERIAKQAHEDAKHANDACNICFGSGRVIVPHPSSETRGDCLVSCYCFRGQRFKEERERIIADWNTEKKKRNERPPLNVMTLFEYEERFTKWRDVVESRILRRRAERSARTRTENWDRRDGQLDMRNDFRVQSVGDAETPF